MLGISLGTTVDTEEESRHLSEIDPPPNKSSIKILSKRAFTY